MDAEATARKQKHVAEEYLSSLSDLQCNSKPLINMLTMLAEENIDYAPVIVKVVEQHIAKVRTDLKLPILYLIDSIVKNVQSSYVALFGQCIVNIFCGVFEKVNEKIRERMYALRLTWNEVFPASKLYNLDVRVKQIDKNWPITAVKQQPTAIHVNPNFLKTAPSDMEELLQTKTRELLELKKRKLELELEATKKHIEEQQKQHANKTTESNLVDPTNIDGKVLASTTAQVPKILPTSSVPATHVHPALLTAQTQIPGAIMSAANPGIYNQNYVRPTMGPRIQQKGPLPIVQQVHPGLATHNSSLNKVKVNPVNPALLSCIRARDPRLMRQQLQTTKTTTQKPINQAAAPLLPQAAQPSNVPDNLQNEELRHASPSSSSSIISNPTAVEESKRDRRAGSKSSKSSRFNSAMERSSKSPTSYTSHRSSKSSGSSSSSSTRNRDSERERHRERERERERERDRDRDRERKRSHEGKSYTKSNDRRYSKTTTPSSSSSSSSSTKHTSASSKPDQNIDETAAATTNASNDKQNRSTSSSPIKSNSKDSNKRSEAGRITTHTINKNGSSSPAVRQDDDDDHDHDEQDVGGNVPLAKDVDLRTASTIDFAGSRSDPQMLELSNKAAVKGLEQTTTTTTSTTTTKTTTTQSSPSSSSTSSLVSASVSASSSMSTVARNDSEDNQTKKLLAKRRESSYDMDIDESMVGNRNAATIDGKKRMSESGVNDEPIAKKSKPTKMDALFGSEDVDLRTLPPPIMSKTLTTSESLTPPPPPNICSSDEDQDGAKIRDSKASTQKNTHQKLPSNFEDVRAKFAKAARLNKFDRATEKARQKLADLNTPNDDETTQEAEDEKIRIILSQAQEMLESNSLNQSQYKHLVQTVMSINEKNKLKEAKRRESLQQQNAPKSSRDAAATTTTTTTPSSPKDEDIASAELSAARDAVLRKRIPKISKATTVPENAPEKPEKKTRNQAPPPSVENEDAHDGMVGGVSVSVGVGSGGLNKLKPKEKRIRHSKWGERTESPANLNANVPVQQQQQQQQQQQRNWAVGPGPAAKRPNVSGMRVGCVPPPPQAPHPPMILGPNIMRPMHGGGGGGGIWPQPPINNNGGPPSNARGGGGLGFGNQMPMIRSSVPPPPQPPPMSIPPVLPALTPNSLPKPCNSIDNPQAELVRTITIDGQSKDIRIYDDVAIVFMELDEPREIGFQPGQRAIIFDNQDPITLRFNDDYTPLMIAGEQHRVRFGFPSRELYIDEHWYEIYFGGPPVSIPINNRIHILKAEGPPPQVNIGPLRHDLVVGKIHMIIEAVNLFPLFLDARTQTFRFNDEEHTVQFADNLLTVILDGQPIHVEYGGLPKSYSLGSKRYYIRFTTLPKGVVPGKVEIKDMIYLKMEQPKKKKMQQQQQQQKQQLPLNNFASEDKSENQMVIEQQQQTVENITSKAEDIQKSVSENVVAAPAASLVTATTALGKINIDELFQKLVSSGILNSNSNSNTTTTTTKAISAPKMDQQEDSKDMKTIDTITKSTTVKIDELAIEKEEEKLPPIIPIDLRKADSIKTRQEAIIMTLYCGMQCSSCGVRFPPEQTIKYSQHLDWHFRQNRRERDSTRKAHSRKWYYDLNDWLQYEEIEDLEEREKNFFEAQQNEMDLMDDASNQRSTNSPVPSCAAGPDDVDRVCDMCQEKFEQFYNEELEEWHLRAAIRVEDKIYHPLCQEDFKASQIQQNDDLSKSNDDDVIMQEDDNAVDVVIKIEEDEKEGDVPSTTPDIIIAEDDDDVIVLPNEEPSVTEIDDDDEYIPVNVTREEMKSTNENKAKDKDESAEMESDVEIQEPTIPFTDLDNYEEKELPTADDNSQASFLNVKIKEEPKDDEDEDDDFEDVGTVLYGPHDEISIQSSEETQTQTILSTDSPITIGGENSLSANNTSNQPQTDETPGTQTSGDADVAHLNITEDSRISIDGNLEPADSHNLSIAGPSPAVPLGTLINRIKINITKNASASATQTTSSNAAATPAEDSEVSKTSPSSTVTTEVPATATSTSTISSLNSNNSNSTKSCNINTITNVVSTIPVLCAGGTMPSSNVVNTSNISNITVIGSYGSYHKPQHHHHQHQQQQQQHQHQHQKSVQVLTTTTSAVNTVVDTSVTSGTTTASAPARQRTPTPPEPATVPVVPVEETITYDLKPALQKANLKKMKKIECGVETSGLCSIM